MTPRQKITPFLWFDGQAEEAMNHYVSIFKNSRIGSVSRCGEGGPGPKGSVMSCSFELEGQPFMALNGGPMFKFTEAISLFVSCETQAEVDDLWTRLSAGGSQSRCGWLKDKFGLSWQIIPKALGEMLGDKDTARSARVMKAMLAMGKIDIADLRRAYDGHPEAATASNAAPAPAAKVKGRFVWYDVMTTDMKGAETFYKAVIGWSAQDSGSTDSSYTLFSAGAAAVGGLMPIPEDARTAGVGPAWMGYIGVDDVDEYAKRVVAAGGTIRRAPRDIPGVGRFAVAGDPHGAGFILFTPTSLDRPPPPPPGTVGLVGWHELYAGERDGAWTFYSDLFGWTKDMAVETPAGLYQTFSTGGAPVGGMMTKPPHVPRPGWLFYFNVEALDAAVARVTANGGAVLHGPMAVPGGSWIAQCRDPQGAMFAIVSNRR